MLLRDAYVPGKYLRDQLLEFAEACAKEDEIRIRRVLESIGQASKDILVDIQREMNSAGITEERKAQIQSAITMLLQGT